MAVAVANRAAASTKIDGGKATSRIFDSCKRADAAIRNAPQVGVGGGEICARRAMKTVLRREYTRADVKELRAHSKAKTPVAKIAKLTKRTEGSLRQKALKLGIRLGHRR